MSFYELLQMLIWPILGGVIIGYIYRRQNWNKYHECIIEKLNNIIMINQNFRRFCYGDVESVARLS